MLITLKLITLPLRRLRCACGMQSALPILHFFGLPMTR